MKEMLQLLFTIFLLLFGFINLYAQHTITTAGGNATGVNGNASYSAGQVVISLSSGINGTAAHGVQQAYEISVVTSSRDVINNYLPVSVFPNPVKDELNLRIDSHIDLIHRSVRVYLYDLTGKLILESEITGHISTISMTGLAPSTYFIKLMNGNIELNHFKIVKM